MIICAVHCNYELFELWFQYSEKLRLPLPSPFILLLNFYVNILFQSHADASDEAIDDLHRTRSISISMPSSPLGVNIESTREVLSSRSVGLDIRIGKPGRPVGSTITNSKQIDHAIFHSLPIISVNTTNAEEVTTGMLRVDMFKDKRFNSFKTWSGKFERQLSHLRGKQQESDEQEPSVSQNSEIEMLPVHRYFDALEGPELETLRVWCSFRYWLS